MTGLGLLLAMMEPPASEEDEFHDWYDTEHIPERAAIDGFINARRFVCIDGWPRYLALYDLERPEVLEEPGYLAVSGDNFSPWSRRVAARVHGQYRAAATQIYPGQAILGDRGAATRIALLRFRDTPSEGHEDLMAGIRAAFEDRPDLLQLRIFRADADHVDHLVIAEMRGKTPPADVAGVPAGMDILNAYVPYWRRSHVPGLFGRR